MLVSTSMSCKTLRQSFYQIEAICTGVLHCLINSTLWIFEKRQSSKFCTDPHNKAKVLLYLGISGCRNLNYKFYQGNSLFLGLETSSVEDVFNHTEDCDINSELISLEPHNNHFLFLQDEGSYRGKISSYTDLFRCLRIHLFIHSPFSHLNIFYRQFISKKLKKMRGKGADLSACGSANLYSSSCINTVRLETRGKTNYKYRKFQTGFVLNTLPDWVPCEGWATDTLKDTKQQLTVHSPIYCSTCSS